MVESRSVSLSIVLHVSALLIAAFGLPALLPPRAEPMPLVMTVELLPVGAITNVKPSEKPIEKEQKAPTPKTTKPVTPSAVEKPKEPAPPAEKKPDLVKEAEPLPSEKPKPVEKPKEKEAEKPKPDEFAALLNKLKQEAKTDQSKEAKDKTNAEENKTRSEAAYDESMPLSISEKDVIRSQFLVCWTMPAGAKDAHTLAVRVKIQLQPDGAVLTATIASDQMGRYNSDAFFKAAADSALRAVHKCSPLKNLPPDKYGSWREMELNFDPADLL
jgi:outer membrane biosynthesis protein TonB